ESATYTGPSGACDAPFKTVAPPTATRPRGSPVLRSNIRTELMSVTNSRSPEIVIPLGALSVEFGLLPSIHLSSSSLPSGDTFEMKPFLSCASGLPLMLLTRYTSSSGTYRTLSGVWRPTSLTTTGGGSGGSAGCCAATGCACGAGGGGAAGGGGGGVAATGVASPRGSHAASADKTTAPRSAWHPPRA